MDLNDILIFVRVAQAGSFSRAAKLLNMPVSTVSRRVAELEEQLGVPLLIRTTRSLKITEVGLTYLEHGQTIAAEIEKVETLATNLQSIPQGNLKITTTTDFGNQFLAPILHDFLKANPRVKVDAVLTERVVDLVSEGFDLAIRMGELKTSSYVARKIGSLSMQLYASPDYLKRSGEPSSGSELSKHQCILFTSMNEPHQWRLMGPEGEAKIQVSGRVSVNNMSLVRDFAISGEGIALMPHFMCTEEVKRGKLKVILKDWFNSPGPIHAVYPGQRYLLPKVRVFVDHLVKHCSGVQWKYEKK